jgi:hypothetical protein
MMKKGVVIALVVGALLAMGNIVRADPVGDFFKKLGNSISNAGKRQPARRGTAKSGAKRPGSKDSNTPPGQPEQNAPDSAALLSPSPAPMVRVATAAPPAKGKKRDVPYGIPVPGKQGFATSPFAPDAGYVDVHDFPPGTEVKDPYTGKIFLTP